MNSMTMAVERLRLEGYGSCNGLPWLAAVRNPSPHSENNISLEEVLLFKAYQSGLWLYYVLLSKCSNFFSLENMKIKYE